MASKDGPPDPNQGGAKPPKNDSLQPPSQPPAGQAPTAQHITSAAASTKAADRIRAQEQTIRDLNEVMAAREEQRKLREEEMARQARDRALHEQQLTNQLKSVKAQVAKSREENEALQAQIRSAEQHTQSLNTQLTARVGGSQDPQDPGNNNSQDQTQNPPSQGVKPPYNMPLIANRRFFDTNLGQKKIYRQLMYTNGEFRSADLIEVNEIPTVNVVCYLRCAANGDPVPMTMAKVLTLGEIAAAGLPDSMYMSRDDANKEFIAAWAWLYNGGLCQMLSVNVADFKSQHPQINGITTMEEAMTMQNWVKESNIGFPLSGTAAAARQ